MKLKIFYSLPFLFLLITNKSFAHDYPPISRLSIEQGLSNNSLRCIFQEHNNFMWFGTYDGLSKYDGYEFRIFRNKLNDSNSLYRRMASAIKDAQRPAGYWTKKEYIPVWLHVQFKMGMA